VTNAIAMLWLAGYVATAYFYERNRAGSDKKVSHAMALATMIAWPYFLAVEVRKWRSKNQKS